MKKPSIFICSVVRPEDNWYHEKDENEDCTGNLLTDDLDLLTSIDFFYLDFEHNGQYRWCVNCVSWPDLGDYLSPASDEFGWQRRLQTTYYHDQSGDFQTVQDALIDLAGHIAFKYCYGYGLGVGPTMCAGNIHRLYGISPIRLNCEPYFLDMIRIETELARKHDHKRSSFVELLGGPITVDFKKECLSPLLTSIRHG